MNKIVMRILKMPALFAYVLTISMPVMAVTYYSETVGDNTGTISLYQEIDGILVLAGLAKYQGRIEYGDKGIVKGQESIIELQAVEDKGFWRDIFKQEQDAINQGISLNYLTDEYFLTENGFPWRKVIKRELINGRLIVTTDDNKEFTIFDMEFGGSGKIEYGRHLMPISAAENATDLEWAAAYGKENGLSQDKIDILVLNGKDNGEAYAASMAQEVKKVGGNMTREQRRSNMENMCVPAAEMLYPDHIAKRTVYQRFCLVHGLQSFERIIGPAPRPVQTSRQVN